MKNRVVRFGIGVAIVVAMMAMFRQLGLSLFYAWAISGGLIIAGLLGMVFYRHKKRTELLLKHCDPEAYIEKTLKQMEIMKTSKKDRIILEMQLAIGYSLAGELDKSLEILKAVDKSALSYANGTLLAYTVSYLDNLYQRGHIEEAEKLFESQIPLLSPNGKRQRQMVALLLLGRLFYLGRYEECKAQYRAELEKKWPLTVKLGIRYNLAVMEDAAGDQDKAMEGFQWVVENGNTLGIVKQSQERLAMLVEGLER